MKTEERQIAINLRKRGLTYREIQKELPVSKSSLSY
jgi:orotate phosphoribosyltransferase-like protein